jgi:hypothetical protein
VKSDLQICVLSFDGFSELWPVFFDYYFQQFPDSRYKINLITNYKIYPDKRVNSLQVGNDISWSSNLIKSLEKIDSERILFLYDDVFFTKFDPKYLEEMLGLTKQHNYDWLTLRPSNFPVQGKEIDIAKISKNSTYRTSLFLSIVKKSTMLELLLSEENAWQFEINGTKRSLDLDFWTVKGSKVEYIHGIIKGVWCYPAYKKITKKRKYTFQKLSERENYLDFIFRVMKQKIYKSYYLFLPRMISRKLDDLRLKKYN